MLGLILGRPLTVPIWYMYERGGDLVVLTLPDSRKGRLLDNVTRLSFCVQSEELPYKYVSVEGPILSVTPADVERDVVPQATRYLGQETASGYVAATRPDGTTKEVVVRVRPERWYAVDFAKRFQTDS